MEMTLTVDVISSDSSIEYGDPTQDFIDSLQNVDADDGLSLVCGDLDNRRAILGLAKSS